MIDLAFQELGLKTLVGKIAVSNPASLGALKNFGFSPVGKEIKKTAKGADLELIIYELNAPDIT